MPSISYDPEVNILSIRLKRVKSVDSELKGNVVLDYDAKGQLTNIDVMNVNLEDVADLASVKK